MSIPASGVQASTLGCEGEKVTRSFNPSIQLGAQSNWGAGQSEGSGEKQVVRDCALLPGYHRAGQWQE